MKTPENEIWVDKLTVGWIPISWDPVIDNICRDCVDNGKESVKTLDGWRNSRTGLPRSGGTLCEWNCRCILAPTVNLNTGQTFSINKLTANLEKVSPKYLDIVELPKWRELDREVFEYEKTTAKIFYGIEANTLAELKGKAFNLPAFIYEIEGPADKLAYLRDAVRQIQSGKISAALRKEILKANRWDKLPGE
jgi:hypothetical protein